jgi:hypothetical protein
MIKTRLMLVSLMALMALPAGVSAQATAWVQARRALQQGPGMTFEHSGFRMAGDPLTGALARGDSVDLVLDLHPGTEYKVVGACDAGCSDLNLTLLDPAGSQVDIDDVPEDNAPIVSARPGQAGQFHVRVSMAACGQPTCRFGIGVYGK